MFLFGFSLFWTLVYAIGGPRLVPSEPVLDESE